MKQIDPDELQLVSVGLEALGNSASIEIWRGTGKVTCHREGRIDYCQNNDFLFGHLLADEKDSNKLCKNRVREQLLLILESIAL